ncbi:hypothetical protein K2173_012735 [Erythroxylum novogranatense]|uniref:Pentatricopeptide repeat-containing protein n=1 Tax=Erythroxylum novogranatense TaxID=1862640 RepID=A0AAV8SRC5_9ROSI|nr:hypothetical protein K2173_012735 [Erythroxylum novogranatense]
MRRSLLKGLHGSLFIKNHPFVFVSRHHHVRTYTDDNIENIPIENPDPWLSLISPPAQGCPSSKPAFYGVSELLNSVAKPNGYTLARLIRASMHLVSDCYCQQLHGYVLKSGFGSNLYVSSALMKLYHETCSMDDVLKLFVEIPHPNVVTWNTLISMFLYSRQFSKALASFLQLDKSGVCPDAYSFTIALSACGQLSLLELGTLIHCRILKHGINRGIVVSNCLIDMYGKCGSCEEATWVFDEMMEKDLISWNSVIAACARNNKVELAYSFFNQMPEPNTISYNELINTTAQFGNINDAIALLSNMKNPNSSSWNSIITAYVNRNQAREALDLFTKMQSCGVELDEYTFSILLSGIAGLSALNWGMLIHTFTMKLGLDLSVVVGTALVDMYSKCGQVEHAESVFLSLPKRNLVTWNAMISGYVQNGYTDKGIQLFEEMKLVKNLKPDWVTFVNVIAACPNDSWSLQKAVQYFKMMIKDYGIQPTVEHCCSMIRLMGQRGKVWSAAKMIRELPFGSSGVIWRALLGACGLCMNLKVAKIAAAKLIVLDGEDDYVYVMLSNIFACRDQWRDASEVRKFMRERRVKKETGCSWIEVKYYFP